MIDKPVKAELLYGQLIIVKRINMNCMHVKSLGFAGGVTAALLYLDCALSCEFYPCGNDKRLFVMVFSRD